MNKDMSVKDIKLSLYYQSKTGYGTLIQNNILKELIILLGATIVDMDIEKNEN